MSSPQQIFVRSIRELEVLANKHPNRYRLRVFLAIALGYGYLLAAIAIFCVYIYNWQQLFNYHALILSSIKLVCLSLLIISACHSIFVKFSPPSGIGLDLDAPANAEFKQLITSISDRYKCQSIDFVIINEDFNLKIVHVPQFGMLAKNCNFLVVGLPLMLALSPSQFKAILARELSHLSTNELRLESWIYRLSKSYHYLLSQLEAKKKLDLVFIKFWRWYVPILDLHCFGLRRKYEYEIDKLAAKTYGTKILAESLVSIELYRQFLGQEFWAEVRDAQKLCPQPPADIYDRLDRSIVDNFDRNKIDRWLETALTKLTEDLDFHPCLKDRLIALGYVDRTIKTLAPSAHLEQNAARKYLDKSLPNLAAELSFNWQQARSARWYQKFLELEKARKSLERLTLKAENSQLARAQSSLDRINEKSTHQDLSIDEFWLLAKRKIQLGDLDGGIIVLYQILEINPHHARTNLWLGSILLEMGNFNGIDYLETAMNVDPGTICEATATIRRFAKIIPDPEDALLCESIANRHYLNWIKNSHKYSKFKYFDLNHKHQITEEMIREIAERAIEIPEIQHIYATFKSRKEDLFKHHYILAIYSFKENASADDEDLQNLYIALENVLECIGVCTIFVFEKNGYYKCGSIIDKLRSIPKACIYNRKKILAANNEDDNDIDRTYDSWR